MTKKILKSGKFFQIFSTFATNLNAMFALHSGYQKPLEELEK